MDDSQSDLDDTPEYLVKMGSHRRYVTADSKISWIDLEYSMMYFREPEVSS